MKGLIKKKKAKGQVMACLTDESAAEVSGGGLCRTQPASLFCWLCFCHTGQQIREPLSLGSQARGNESFSKEL